MVRSAFLLIAAFVVGIGPAFAQAEDAKRELLPSVAHLAFTFLGLVVAARLAWQAFGRAVPIATVPTFPKYMTTREQYRLGSLAFILFACAVFLLLVYNHREVLALVPSNGVIPESILRAARDQSAPYLAIIAAIGGVYLFLLTKEFDWNVLLIMRDVIHSWISVPQLAKRIIGQIRFTLRIPQEALESVIANSPEVVEQDFRKDPNAPDRMWAEICYMKWWLIQGQNAGDDGTFFSEESFGFERLIQQFQQASWSMSLWKSGAAPGIEPSQFAQSVKDLHIGFARLVACYLIYRNGSRRDLCREARKFGIDLYTRPLENPLRYWIIYFTALICSVYVGVMISAIAYDVFDGRGVIFAQDSDRLQAWLMYSLCNYGLAIIAVLLVRLVMNSWKDGFSQSHLVTYCWTFIVAFAVGPFGLAVAVHFFGQGDLRSMPLHTLYYVMLRWGLGPALVAVYISYYLDRQVCDDLPDIDRSTAKLGWQLLNCFAFAAATVFLLLPALLALTAPEAATWDTNKLRFIAAGTTFSVTLGLALAAQFALRKEVRATDIRTVTSRP